MDGDEPLTGMFMRTAGNRVGRANGVSRLTARRMKGRTRTSRKIPPNTWTAIATLMSVLTNANSGGWLSTASPQSLRIIQSFRKHRIDYNSCLGKSNWLVIASVPQRRFVGGGIGGRYAVAVGKAPKVP